MPSTINDLPGELLEEIVDASTTYPTGDYKAKQAKQDTLRALSLTSSILRPISQSRLFSSITIVTKYEEYVEDTNALDRLYEVFTDSPHLARHATHLSVLSGKPRKKKTDRESIRDWDKTQRSGNHTLIKILTILHPHNRLEHFSVASLLPRHGVRGADQIGRSASLVRAIVKTLRMPSLVRVDMKGMPFDAFRFCQPNVRHLAVWDALVEWNFAGMMSAPSGEEDDGGGGGGGTTTEPAPGFSEPAEHAQDDNQRQVDSEKKKLQLDTFVIRDAYSSPPGSQLSAFEEIIKSEHLDLSGVRKLSVGIEHVPDEIRERMHSQVAKLLERCSSTLEELSLTPSLASFDTNHDPPLPPESITLASLTSLRVLHIGIQSGLCDSQTAEQNPIPWLLTLLNTLPPTNIVESLTISSGYGLLSGGGMSYWGTEFNDYAALDRILCGGNLIPNLQRVRWFIEESRFLLTRFDESYTTSEAFAKRTLWVVTNVRQKMPGMMKKNKNRKMMFEMGPVFPPLFVPPLFAHKANT